MKICIKNLLLLPVLIAGLGLMLPALLQAQTYTNSYGVWNYSENGDGTYSITGYTGTNTVVTIPNTIPVNSIDMPVSSIGSYAFQFSGLVSITIGVNVTSIGSETFAACSSLTGIYFEGNAPSFGSYTFFLSNPAIYYVAGTTGWGSTYDGLTTVEEFPEGASTITVSASPITGGTVVGGGRFASGSIQTVTAIAASNYTFVSWTENGNVVSSAAAYTFTLGSNLNLVANFNGGIGGTSRQISFQVLNDPVAVNGSYAQGIDGGNVVGYYKDNEDVAHGFVYNGSGYTTLDDPNAGRGFDNGTYASGISGNTIVGYYYDTNNIVHGFSYANGAYTTLDDPNEVYGTWVQGIDGNNFVGYYRDGNNTAHGFLYDGSSFITLNDLAGNGYTFARAISAGSIVGNFSDGNVEHGFIYTNGNYTTVDEPNAPNINLNGSGGTYVQGVSGGKIAGYFWGSDESVHGFIYIASAYVAVDYPNANYDNTYVTGISGTNIVGYSGTNSFIAAVGPTIDFSVSAAALPIAAGTIGGIGSFTSGTSQTVTATPNSGYKFVDWSVNGNVVSLWASYNFIVNSNMNLVANFSGGGGGSQMQVFYQTLDDPDSVYGTYPEGVSDGGIVGNYVIGDIYEQITQGFLYSNNNFITLVAAAPNEDGYTSANGIDGNNIVGSYIYLYSASPYYEPTPVTAGFLYTNGTYALLADPEAGGNGVAGTWITGISGTNIIGYYEYYGSNYVTYRGLIYFNDGYVNMDDPNGTATYPSGISGTNIVGYYSTENGIIHGFLYANGSYTNMDDPNGVATYPTGISGNKIVGYYYDAGENAHGFLYANGNYTTLDEPNGLYDGFTKDGTYVRGISGNTLVGYYMGMDGVFHGFIATMTTMPPLAINSVSFFGANLEMNGINGVSGETNYVLTSTNLTLPLNQWIPVATNILNASGNFTIIVTNTVIPSIRQRFYVLQLQ